MRRSTAIVLLWILSTLAAGCPRLEDRLAVARVRVPEALARGDREAALAALAPLRGSEPDTPETLIEVSQLLVQTGEAPEALRMLEAGSARFPERDDVRLALARAAMLLASPSLAHAALMPVAAGSAQHFEALVLRAQAELQLGDLEQALATLAEAERLHPDRPESRLVRIATLLQERRHDEARAAIDDARAKLGTSEEDAALRRRLDLASAQLRAARGEREEALASLAELVAAEPGDLLAWRLRAEILVGDGRAEQVVAELEAAAREHPEEVALARLLAPLYARVGRSAEAEAALRRLVEAPDADASAWTPLVELHFEQEDLARAEQVLREALGKHPEDPGLLLLYTETLLMSGDTDGARSAAARFRDATFRGDPQVEYLEARLSFAGGDAAGAAQRLERLAPRLDRAATHFWLGGALEEQGDLDGALRRYAMAERRDPLWLAPPFALLRLAQRRAAWADVAAQAQVVVSRAPARTEGWMALGEALAKLGQREAAAEVVARTRERFPDRVEPALLATRVAREEGRHDDALAFLDAAEERFGPSPELAVERALTLGMAGRVPEGIAAVREALARGPETAALHGTLGGLLFAAGEAEEGARAVDRALALDPGELHPLRERCRFRAATGRLEDARADCLRYSLARPDDPETRFALGAVHAGLGEAKEAEAAYRRAAALDEGDFRPRNNLADLLAKRGDVAGALAAAQEAYRLAPHEAAVLDTLGSLYLEQGLVERALSLLEEAHANDPATPEIQLHLALAYQRAGRGEQARQLLSPLAAESSAAPELRRRAQTALDAPP